MVLIWITVLIVVLRMTALRSVCRLGLADVDACRGLAHLITVRIRCLLVLIVVIVLLRCVLRLVMVVACIYELSVNVVRVSRVVIVVVY